MATIINDRDVLLQGATRDLDPRGGKYLLLQASTPIFHVTAGGVASPATITLTVLLGGLTGTVNWTASVGALSGAGNLVREYAYTSLTGNAVTITASLTDVNGQVYTATQVLSKVQDGSGTNGTNGFNTGFLRVYQWSTVAPALPNGNATLTWGTGAVTAYTGDDGWALNAPANPGVSGIQLWQATKSLSAIAGTVTTTGAFTGGSVMSISANGTPGANGANGTNGAQGLPGIKSAQARVYQWGNGPTPTISGAATYTWNTATFSFTPTNWSASKPNSPSTGYTLFEATVGLIDSSGATTTAFDWATATVVGISYVGTNGANGGTGATGATGAAGSTGDSAVIAYTLVDGNSLNVTPATYQNNAAVPATGVWGETRAWQTTPPTPAAGQSVFQSNGTRSNSSGVATWGVPYLSSLRVGQLSSLTLNTGTLTVTGTISSGNGNFSVDLNGNVIIKSGTSGNRTEINNDKIVIYNNGVPKIKLGNLA